MKLKDVLTENKKENIYVEVKKQRRKEKTERIWRAYDRWKLYENSELGDWYLLVKFKKQFTFV